jgi:hypothetical protein
VVRSPRFSMANFKSLWVVFWAKPARLIWQASPVPRLLSTGSFVMAVPRLPVRSRERCRVSPLNCAAACGARFSQLSSSHDSSVAGAGPKARS